MFLVGATYNNKTQPQLSFLVSSVEVRLDGLRLHGTWVMKHNGELICNDTFLVKEGDMHEWSKSAEQTYVH